MRLRRSLAILLGVAFVSGCGGSSNYTGGEVAKALRNHGFSRVELMSKEEWELLLVFPQPIPGDVRSVVSDREPVRTQSGNQSTLVLEGWIFGKQDKASCGATNIFGTCLRKRNVVVFVRKRRAQAARAALDELS